MTIKAYILQCQLRVDEHLKAPLSNLPANAQGLQEALNYSVFNGGKRVRPMLTYATCEALGGDIEAAHAPACAVEMIHAYSLVHDDLPAMDDDDLRRGKPTCHIAFDEATAILVGDALQTLAFEQLIDIPGLSAEARLALLRSLSAGAGVHGMVSGQAMDIEAENRNISLDELECLHRHKTGALIRSAVEMGAIVAGATPAQRDGLLHYASCIGLAFQVQDDIIDIESDTATLGKRQGADQALNKATYPSLLGLEGAKQKALALRDEALAAISDFDAAAQPLRDLAAYIVERRS